MASTLRWIVTVLTVVLSGVHPVRAQIDELRNIDGKTVECLHSGLISDLDDCGFRSDWYVYVFVGSISAVTPAGKDEKNLQITPEEVFHGEPPTPLTVLTSQGACLPKLTVGDRWLFFLRKEHGKPIVLDYYGNDSRPVAHAREQIETLRRLKTIGEFGIVRGNVERGPNSHDGKAVPGAHVVAFRTSDNAQFSATTDTNGHYEFEPLAPGEYKLTVDPVGSFQPDDSGVEVGPGACWGVALSKSPHAQLGGHVKHSDGSSVPKVPVLIMYEDGSWFTTEESDADGYFRSDGMRPGRYVVGINLPGAAPWKNAGGAGANVAPRTAPLFYPGMHNRSDALVITLADDEKRDDINFVIPTQ
jgi:hypothetical protein